MQLSTKYCLYYQAQVAEKNQWFLVAVLRSFEHLAFDRTLDKEQGIFEFFVPVDNVDAFREVMEYFTDQGIVKDLQKLPNRLAE